MLSEGGLSLSIIQMTRAKPQGYLDEEDWA